MSDLVRTSIAMERELHDQLEDLLASGPFENRSEFFREMVRDRLVQQQWARDEEVLGTVTVVYDHNSRELSNKLVSLQHEVHSMILASTHVHLNHDLCAEVIIAKGTASAIQHFVDLVSQQRGVLHAALSMSTTGAQVSVTSISHHGHDH
jgi:CopG family nickel-responsive transcriptional regulator